MAKLLVLDMDDTLYLESEYVASGFAAAASCIESKELSSQFLASALNCFRKGMRGDIFNRALQDCGIEQTPNRIASLLSAYRDHKPSIILCDDAHYFLNNLSDNIKTALVSDGYLPPQERKAEALDLYNRLDKIILTETLGREHWKPSPEAFKILEAHFGIYGKDCTYVGDNPRKDFDGPQSLNWKTVRIRRTGALHRDVPDKSDCTADFEITTLDQLAEFLES